MIAEGVETVRQREILKALGCDCVQGFLFARPRSRKAIDELVLCQTQPRLTDARSPR